MQKAIIKVVRKAIKECNNSTDAIEIIATACVRNGVFFMYDHDDDIFYIGNETVRGWNKKGELRIIASEC